LKEEHDLDAEFADANSGEPARGSTHNGLLARNPFRTAKGPKSPVLFIVGPGPTAGAYDLLDPRYLAK
jgi:hypothetical protein